MPTTHGRVREQAVSLLFGLEAEIEVLRELLILERGVLRILRHRPEKLQARQYYTESATVHRHDGVSLELNDPVKTLPVEVRYQGPVISVALKVNPGNKFKSPVGKSRNGVYGKHYVAIAPYHERILVCFRLLVLGLKDRLYDVVPGMGKPLPIGRGITEPFMSVTSRVHNGRTKRPVALRIGWSVGWNR